MVISIRPLTPKQQRILTALLNGPLTRRQAGDISGALNAPQVILELRRKGIPIVTEWQCGIDRDNRPYRMGIYSLPPTAHHQAREWLNGELEV